MVTPLPSRLRRPPPFTGLPPPPPPSFDSHVLPPPQFCPRRIPPSPLAGRFSLSPPPFDVRLFERSALPPPPRIHVMAAAMLTPPSGAMVSSWQAQSEGPRISFAGMLTFLQREYHSVRLEYDSVGDNMLALDPELKTKMPKPTDLLMFSTPAPAPGFSGNNQADETVTKELTNIHRQFTQLGEELRGILNKIDEVKTLQYKLVDIGWLIPEIIVIAFVDDLEKADQYFDFKDYLRRKHDIEPDFICVDNADKLVMNEEVRKMYDKLDKEYIERAINAIKWERTFNDIRSRRAEYIEFLKALNIERNGESACLEEDYEQMASIHPTLNSNELEEMDIEAFLDPVSNMVYYTRAKVHVMDEEPKTELQKIREFDDCYFARCVQEESPRAALKSMISTYKDMPREDVLAAIRTKLYGKALERYSAFRKKYAKEQTEDAEKPAKDEPMPDNNWKRVAFERYQALRLKYSKEQTEDMEKPAAKDELMPDNNWKRAALEGYNEFRKKYTKEQRADAEKAAKDELMLDHSRKRALPSKNDGEPLSSQSIWQSLHFWRSVRPRTTE